MTQYRGTAHRQERSLVTRLEESLEFDRERLDESPMSAL